MYLVCLIALLVPPIFGAVHIAAPNSLTYNSLTYNALTSNGLTGNALTNNGLVGNALSGNALTLQSVQAQLQATNENNTALLFELVPYLIRCALPPGQTCNLTINGSSINIAGELGLAASFATNPMTLDEQQRVSACLLAHVNFFGRPTIISARQIPFIAASLVEIETFQVFEGAFFGNIFDSANFTKFSCVGDDKAIALANSDDRQWRVCTALDNKCDFESLGACSQVCATFDPNYGFSQCTSNGVVYPAVNVFLKSNTATSSSSHMVSVQPLGLLVLYSLLVVMLQVPLTQ